MADLIIYEIVQDLELVGFRGYWGFIYIYFQVFIKLFGEQKFQKREDIEVMSIEGLEY